MRYAVTALLIAVATVSLSGCGQTGPLYMPPVPEPEPEPVPATTPQAQPAAADSAEQQTKDP